MKKIEKQKKLIDNVWRLAELSNVEIAQELLNYALEIEVISMDEYNALWYKFFDDVDFPSSMIPKLQSTYCNLMNKIFYGQVPGKE